MSRPCRGGVRRTRGGEGPQGRRTLLGRDLVEVPGAGQYRSRVTLLSAALPRVTRSAPR